jgi:hypothetical protein
VRVKVYNLYLSFSFLGESSIIDSNHLQASDMEGLFFAERGLHDKELHNKNSILSFG